MNETTQSDWERRLSECLPHPPQLDREQLMYEAGRSEGRAATRRASLRWRRIAAASAMAAAALLAIVLKQAAVAIPSPAESGRLVKAPVSGESSSGSASGSSHIEQVEIRPVAVRPATPSAPLDFSGHWAQRRLALTFGFDELPLRPRTGATGRRLTDDLDLAATLRPRFQQPGLGADRPFSPLRGDSP